MTDKPDIANGKGSPGIAKLFIDRKLVGQTDVSVTTPLSLGLTGGGNLWVSSIGHQSHLDYQPPLGEFTDKIYNMIVDVSGQLIEDKGAEMHIAMARQ